MGRCLIAAFVAALTGSVMAEPPQVETSCDQPAIMLVIGQIENAEAMRPVTKEAY